MRFIWSWMADTLWRQSGQQLNLRVGAVEWATVKRLATRFLVAYLAGICLMAAGVLTVWQKGYIDGEEPVSNDSEQARPEAAASQDAPYEMLDSEKHIDKKRQTAEGSLKSSSLTEKRQTGILRLRKR